MVLQPPNTRQLSDGSVLVLSPEELEDYRSRATALRSEPQGIMLRSCWSCNGAHLRLAAVEDSVLACFGCGRYFLEGADITIYSETEAAEGTNRELQDEAQP